MRSLILLFLLPFAAHAQISPTLLTPLAGDVDETSGLLLLNGALWTHNDAGNTPHLYQIDIENGSVLRTVEVTNAPNIDWEDITTDGTYVYIGDVGNNSGARTDLRILRFPASQLEDAEVTSVEVEVIAYAYEDQQDFQPANNANDWDCEAIIAKDDSIFLFTKNWVDQQTRLYAVPATPGEHVAQLRAQHDVQGMITGSAYEPASGEVVLVGYTNILFVPFMVRLSEFEGNAFFSGSVIREAFTLSFVQVEAVEWNGPSEIYMTNESSPFSPARLWGLPMPEVTSVDERKGNATRIHPNPASDWLQLDGVEENVIVTIHDLRGRTILAARNSRNGPLDVSGLASGIYTVKIPAGSMSNTRLLMIQR
jgi:hypothetical protein